MFFVIVILFRSFALFTRVVHVGFVLFLRFLGILVHFVFISFTILINII